MSYDEHLISMAGGDGDVRAQQARAQSDGHDLAAVIHTRRLRKCIAEGAHVDGACGRCGL